MHTLIQQRFELKFYTLNTFQNKNNQLQKKILYNITIHKTINYKNTS